MPKSKSGDKVGFENIKVDDVVCVQTSVRTGRCWHKQFWVPQKVSKVTQKHFMILGQRYEKADGSCVGERHNAAFLGATVFGKKVTDQTHEKKALEKRLGAVYEIKSIIDQFEVGCDHKNLYEIHALIKQAEKLSTAADFSHF